MINRADLGASYQKQEDKTYIVDNTESGDIFCPLFPPRRRLRRYLEDFRGVVMTRAEYSIYWLDCRCVTHGLQVQNLHDRLMHTSKIEREELQVYMFNVGLS